MTIETLQNWCLLYNIFIQLTGSLLKMGLSLTFWVHFPNVKGMDLLGWNSFQFVCSSINLEITRGTDDVMRYPLQYGS